MISKLTNMGGFHAKTSHESVDVEVQQKKEITDLRQSLRSACKSLWKEVDHEIKKHSSYENDYRKLSLIMCAIAQLWRRINKLMQEPLNSNSLREAQKQEIEAMNKCLQQIHWHYQLLYLRMIKTYVPGYFSSPSIFNIMRSAGYNLEENVDWHVKC